jgi:transcriptional regulator GlxA family with amidase domain
MNTTFAVTGPDIQSEVSEKHVSSLEGKVSESPRLASQGERARLAGVEERSRAGVLEQFLVPRMVGAQIDPRVQCALKRIEDCAGQMPIAELARACRVSPRHLNRLMRNWVGVSAKRLARFVRFQAVLQRMEASPDNSARVAAELGYFDQAHLANEVAQFAGTSPGLVAAHRVADFSKTRCE